MEIVDITQRIVDIIQNSSILHIIDIINAIMYNTKSKHLHRRANNRQGVAESTFVNGEYVLSPIWLQVRELEVFMVSKIVLAEIPVIYLTYNGSLTWLVKVPSAEDHPNCNCYHFHHIYLNIIITIFLLS